MNAATAKLYIAGDYVGMATGVTVERSGDWVVDVQSIKPNGWEWLGGKITVSDDSVFSPPAFDYARGTPWRVTPLKRRKRACRTRYKHRHHYPSLFLANMLAKTKDPVICRTNMTSTEAE